MPVLLSSMTISDWLGGHGIWGPALLMTMMVIAVVVGPITTLAISAGSGLAFGIIGAH